MESTYNIYKKINSTLEETWMLMKTCFTREDAEREVAKLNMFMGVYKIEEDPYVS